MQTSEMGATTSAKQYRALEISGEALPGSFEVLLTYFLWTSNQQYDVRVNFRFICLVAIEINHWKLVWEYIFYING